MKNHRLQQKNTAHARKVWLLAALLAGALAMTGCYMEPDRIVDDNNGLTVATGGQQFDTVITPTPNVTATPEPTAPTATDNQQVDWSSWDFGNDTATNPPSNVINIGDNTATSNVTVGLSTPTPTPAMTASTSSTLRTGASGAAVKQLQQRLKELGYYTGSVDGSYGAGTASAVKDFQAANNLGADGVAGSKTQEAMYSYYAVAKKNSSTGSSSGSNSSSSGSSSSGSTSTSQYTNGKTDIYLKLGSSATPSMPMASRGRPRSPSFILPPHAKPAQWWPTSARSSWA